MRGRDRLRRRRGSKGRCRRLVCHPFPATPLADPRFRHLCQQFHALGPLALAEFLAELAAERLLRSEVEARLEAYLARLDRDLLEATGGAELVAMRPRHSQREYEL